MTGFPPLKHFRMDMAAPDIAHLMFDTPGRPVNVLSAAALADLEAAIAWVAGSGLAGLVLSSAKPAGFCAGADVDEFAAVHAMVATTPPARRMAALRGRFAPFTRAFRALETAGVPVAVAIDGPALGGGLELALAGHWRVMTDARHSRLGLPEIGVGLFPAGGGTQRLPRLIGLDAALPLLLDGQWLSAEAALAVGLADRMVAPGAEVDAAVDWLRGGPDPRQPWDRPGGDRPPPAPERMAELAGKRQAVALGHYPAVTALLDCLERGLPLDMDRGNAIELDALARLLLRPEPKVMMATLFHGRQAHQRAAKLGVLPPWLPGLLEAVAGALAGEADRQGRTEAETSATRSGFTRPLPAAAPLSINRLRDASPADWPEVEADPTGLWFDAPAPGWQASAARLLAVAVLAAARHDEGFGATERQLADFAAVTTLGFPAYLGGPFALLAMAGTRRVTAMLSA